MDWLERKEIERQECLAIIRAKCAKEDRERRIMGFACIGLAACGLVCLVLL